MLLGAAQFECQPPRPAQLIAPIEPFSTMLRTSSSVNRKPFRDERMRASQSVQRYVRIPSECSTVCRSEKKMLPTAVSSPHPRQGSFADDERGEPPDTGDLRGGLPTIGAVNGRVKCHAAGEHG